MQQSAAASRGTTPARDAVDSLPPLPPACLFSRPYLPHHRSCIHRILSPTLPCPRRVFTCCRTATLAADTAHSNTKPSPSYVMQVCGVSHTAVPSEVAGVQGGMQDARFRACFSLLNSGLASWHFPTLPPSTHTQLGALCPQARCLWRQPATSTPAMTMCPPTPPAMTLPMWWQVSEQSQGQQFVGSLPGSPFCKLACLLAPKPHPLPCVS